ncbi:Crp/Fnr family transcriptional regulator [Cereibacter sphaeroides]|uniref:Crp/Fnr family transcriptional regulator n=1 Tax=Rhodobacterales TaxID=204455 RepID=UPI000BBEC808|nr:MULTISPECIES: Crp/Fnr family transcriptional regulator [Paracoccaceae]MCE6950660.1 Crp/Fnr family transcriptional regulator [Cereibacter sphaeroides]MCE6959113.1 Crp/Fnr family transcriptional regulator [Cereibacter sphaeroides]MCE6968354.1 Crp/Fnr family transcriptional regulator [Cereibacter sphaeroides]MCE6974226.1 Crp/Fnr family transcriptional regulator [Cereibacter sphaeroides]
MKQSADKSVEDLRSLSTLGWLARQPVEFQMRLAAVGRWATIERGQQLYTVGDPPNAIFGLEEGLLDVSIPISSDEEVTIYRARPGFWVGDSALLAGTTRSITVSAATECRVFRLPIGAVRRALQEHPEDWICFFRLNHENATLAVRILAEVLSLPPRVRFARMLLRLACPDGSVRATQEDLGRMAGMSRAAFRRAFATLIDSGAVRTEYGGVRITDRAALEREAETG